jgi:SAM-dependent methyltransferase
MSFDAKHSLRDYCGMGVEDVIPEAWFKEIDKKDLNILEVGFGKGSLLKKLNHDNGPNLYGIDCSQNNFRHVLYNYKVKANIAIADISKENFQYPDGHFDIVIMLEVLEHIMSPLHAMLEIKRVLKADGTFIFSWPEERMISGIGKEENQMNRKYENGFHAFPYPGLFRYDYMRVFFNQLYFRIIDEDKKDYHIYFKMLNMKKNRPEVLDVVNGDYDTNILYGDIKTMPKLSW